MSGSQYPGNQVVDMATLLKDSYAVAASAAAQVASAAQVLDLLTGTAIPLVAGLDDAPELRGVVIVDVSAIDIASTDECYTISLQASSSASFASDIANLCSLQLGATAVIFGGATVQGAIGRYFLPFVTMRKAIHRRYLRLYTTVSGSTPSITYTARLGKNF